MAKVEIVPSLKEEIYKRFKGKSIDILEHLQSLEQTPQKGKSLGHIGGIAIKELKYEGFRFYFITDAHKIRVFNTEALTDLLIRFVRMSDKKAQQKVIDESDYSLP
ncbi:hypothetical protein COU60_04775 [Candidatus Pacearchaeota archaeon CG10_big_fil_rev_8_21_14_0_10_34_76]|nr:MAG: hypothetical protein COU60_04775 [Candidatus Pacearchaeota archaeon CG10_big_fil_rev_8_21_14_0_10_34_76]